MSADRGVQLANDKFNGYLLFLHLEIPLTIAQSIRKVFIIRVNSPKELCHRFCHALHILLKLGISQDFSLQRGDET